MLRIDSGTGGVQETQSGLQQRSQSYLTIDDDPGSKRRLSTCVDGYGRENASADKSVTEVCRLQPCMPVSRPWTLHGISPLTSYGCQLLIVSQRRESQGPDTQISLAFDSSYSTERRSRSGEDRNQPFAAQTSTKKLMDTLWAAKITRSQSRLRITGRSSCGREAEIAIMLVDFRGLKCKGKGYQPSFLECIPLQNRGLRNEPRRRGRYH